MRLGKARKIFRQLHKRYRRKGGRLSAHERAPLEDVLEQLDQALLNRDKKSATTLVREARIEMAERLPKSRLERGWEFCVAIAVAIVVAVVIRQMWFEPMEIPSGSMRPTYLESDRLFVSKLPFGLNVPMRPRQFLFYPELVQRTTPFIFTSEDMDIPDQDTTFLFFPSKRRLIKRCMGKPGDTLYFYGGRVYGIDKEGNDLPTLRDLPDLFYVPFMQFDGKVTGSGPFYLNQFNEPLARLSLSPTGQIRAELRLDDRWTTRGPPYSDFYGIKNYAMARLLTRKQLELFSEPIPDPGLLYLELRHNPTLTSTHIGRDEQGRIRPMLTPETSVIALGQEQLDRLFSFLYTCRFMVKNGKAFAERHASIKEAAPYALDWPDIPNGRYEFEKGVAYAIHLTGVRTRLPDTHPLYDRTPENIQRLFNLGMDMLVYYAPLAREQISYPSRFAFWRDGELYVMNGPLFAKSELQPFLDREKSRPHPFIDHGPPSRETIEQFGFQTTGFLGLGDNYAGSGDSRQFGPVPGENIRGAPSTLIWPPDGRWGFQNRPPRPLFTPPRLIVWTIAAIGFILYGIRRRRQSKQLHFQRLK
jgi:signal peptidase I